MPRGGARAVSGPAPDPNALRRDRKSDAAGWVLLPAEGRQEPAPEWPLLDQDPREKSLWESLWSRPQALMWEQMGMALEVALCVRNLVRAEDRESTAAQQTIVRQFMESLGLSVQGMLRNRWKVAPTSPTTDQTPSPAARPSSVRSRFRVVASDGD